MHPPLSIFLDKCGILVQMQPELPVDLLLFLDSRSFLAMPALEAVPIPILDPYVCFNHPRGKLTYLYQKHNIIAILKHTSGLISWKSLPI